MPFYLHRETPKLWRKICAEALIEIALIAENWKLLLAGIVFQYIHGLAAHGIHYLHRPGPILQDIGFFLLPELEQWTLHPFVFQSKRIYTVLIWCRVLAYLVACQALRIVTFYSTHLPGPNYHCLEGSKLAMLPHPESAIELLVINFFRGVNCGCGDFFIAHDCHNSVCVYISQIWQKESLLIIATHKHYTVDVVVAWYTVNLVTFFIDKKLPELPDRSTGLTSLPLLPQTRDKDNKNKEEQHKLLTGISIKTPPRSCIGIEIQVRNIVNSKLYRDISTS